MTFAARIRPLAMAAALAACALAIPGFAQTQGGTTTPPLPMPPPQPIPPSSAPAPLPEGAIGTAEMDSDGTIFLHLKAPEKPTPETWQTRESAVPWSPQERMGYGEITIDRLNPHYRELLVHLAGLERGHDVTVWPWRAGEEWHCAFDPDRGPCPGLHPVPNGTAQR